MMIIERKPESRESERANEENRNSKRDKEIQRASENNSKRTNMNAQKNLKRDKRRDHRDAEGMTVIVLLQRDPSELKTVIDIMHMVGAPAGGRASG
mmetsp:Transcript_16240/g.32915  ORF Transcript_16240/g.32915 Transcript_16240/m.32915 type:complete len:96 (+) Transcript_16240:1837-2124(+)